MRLYLDLLTDQLTTGPGTNEPIRSVSFKRGVGSRIEVQCLRNSIVEELPDESTGVFEIKTEGEYDAVPLVKAGTWTKEGTGTDTLYVFAPSFNTAPLNALLGHGDGDVTNDQASVDGMAEIQWIVDGATHKTQTFEAIIENDVIKDADLDPGSAPDPELWMRAPLLLAEPPLSQDAEVLGDLTFDGDPLIIPVLTPSGPRQWSSTGESDAVLTDGWLLIELGTTWVIQKWEANSLAVQWNGYSAESPGLVEAYTPNDVGDYPITGNATVSAHDGAFFTVSAERLGQLAISKSNGEIYICTLKTPTRWRGPIPF